MQNFPKVTVVIHKFQPFSFIKHCFHEVLFSLSLASKRARRRPPPPGGEPKFTNEAHKTRYALLSRKAFGTIRRIDWGALKTLGLHNTVREYISHGGWDKVFEIEEPTYRELTLEVLSTIEVANYCHFTRQASSISFRYLARNIGFLKIS